MSLFSGMRLTAGKKPTQSISAKVQDRSSSSGNHGNIEPRTKTRDLSHQPSDIENTPGGVPPEDKVPSEMRIDTRAQAADISATSLSLDTHASELSVLPKTITDDMPSVADTAANIGTTNVKLDSEIKSKDSYKEPSTRAQGGSMFSFITTAQSDESSISDGTISSEVTQTGSPNTESISDNTRNLLKSDLGNIPNQGNIPGVIPSDDAMSSSCGRDSNDILTDLDSELDPFSVDKPITAADGRNNHAKSSSKLSFDLEGLVLSPRRSQASTTSRDVLVPASEDDVDDKNNGSDYKDVVVKVEAFVKSNDDNDPTDSEDGGYVPVNFGDDTETNTTTSPEIIMDSSDRGEHGREDNNDVEGSVLAGINVEPQYDVQLSFKDRFEVLQQMNKAKLRHFSDTLSEITSQLSSAASKCIQSSANLLKKQQTLKQIQSQQSAAIAKEDYEQAELLNVEYETLEEALQKMPSLATIPTKDPVILDLIDAVAKLNQEERNCRREQLTQMEEMRNQQETSTEKVKGQYTKMEANEKCQLDEEQNTLQRDIGHLNLDKEHLEKKELQLKTRIDEKTADVRQQRNELCTRRQRIQEEILELEKKLASLKHQEAELAQEIAHQDEAISEAKEEFKGELETLDRERSEVNEKDVDVRKREENLRQAKETMTSKLEKGRIQVISEESLLDNITQEIEILEQTISELDDNTSAEPRVSTVAGSEQDYQKLYSLQDQLKSLHSTVQTLTGETLQDQTKLVGLRQKVSDTEGHIATLTDAKKIAVSGRNFAEAKRLANEIKDLTFQGQKSQAELEEISQRREKNSYKLETLREDIESMKTKLVREELQYDSDLQSRLLHHVEQQTITRTSDNATSPISQALNSADVTVCVSLIQYLCIKHGNTVPGCLQEHIKEMQKTKEDDGNILAGDGSIIDSTIETESDIVSAEVLEFHSEIEALESQLQAAVDEEDYDAAQLLQEQIESLQRR